MTDEPCFPEEPAIEPRPVPAQRRLEFRDHSQGEGTVPAMSWPQLSSAAKARASPI